MQSGGNGLSPGIIAGSVRWCEEKVWYGVRVQDKSEV